MASTSWRSTTNSMNPQNSFKKNYSSFPSIYNDKQPNQPPSTTSNTLQFPSNRGSIDNLRNSRQFTTNTNTNTNTNTQTQSSKSIQLMKWCFDWLINKIFNSYPIWIQSIITAIIGFIAYFLYDYAANIQSIYMYLMYKTTSIILFLISVSFLYLLFLNMNKPKSNTTNNINTIRNIPPMNTNTMGNNPYSISQTNPISNTQTSNMNINSNTTSDIHVNNAKDDLYFTNKAMLNRVSSTVLKSTEPKYDFSSSPNKIESLDPNQIVTQKNLKNFLQNQKHKKGYSSINEYDNVYNRAPSSAFTTSSIGNIGAKTPIGKAFGSMIMTPAVNNKFESSTRSSFWNTPNKVLNNTNQGSAGIATPESSNMDVTMLSYDNTDTTEPFPADFSVIQPTPMAKNQSVAWNVSGFGGFNVNPNMNTPNIGDISNMAQPGTPGKGNISGIGNMNNNNIGNKGYDYDGMYSDVNLRGDSNNIGQILRNTTVTNIQQQPTQIQGQQKVRITNTAPISPFSRKKREKIIDKKSNRMSNIVFTSMGVKKSQFAAYYMEKSINLYFQLRIDTLIANWAESMRWWLGEMIKNRNNELYQNNCDINRIFNLLSNKYNLKQQLSEFITASQKESFILQNENQLVNVAKSENNPAIMHIIQKRKHLRDCIDFVCFNYRLKNENNLITDYIYNRINLLSSTNNLSLYKWNGGDEEKWKYNVYPTDAHLLMTLFCRYMDDAMCPAVKFSEKHYIQISYSDIKKPDKLYKKFKDIAIVCVSDVNISQTSRNKNDFYRKYDRNDEYKDIMDQDSLPYYFIAFNKNKFEKKIKSYGQFKGGMSQTAHFGSGIGGGGGIQKPKHFLYDTWNNFSNNLNNSFNNYFYNDNNDNNNKKNNIRGGGGEGKEEEDYYFDDNNNNNNKRKKKESDSVGVWFPQPGKDNLIHTITLFALFIHRYCDNKLTGIALKDQGCTLLQPILR